ncbi:HD domain-containing phosphohydrolase [Crassaminicella profunda]|uniref:HD domain-containing phosphohydrolase n=1 Tax=Crassaminicella profunda TaxID=1286698 RepID=UPI001CA64ABF|nr:HD domain-containing phosphohydrolase [Crassaminicella profunda]QZY55248.1 HD domain-containing protein [Crassaminicella profunda]
MRKALENAYKKIKKQEKLLDRLNKIGIHLSAEQNTDKLLEMIVEESMKITDSDGGSIYIKEEKEKEEYLRFKIARNYSKIFPFKQFLLPIDKKSISGFCALTGKSYNFRRVSDIPSTIGIKYNDSFDKKNNYKTINMLVIPMKNLKGETTGVLQLINKKKDYHIPLITKEDYKNHTLPFSEEEENTIASLASLAAILLERSKLYQEIKNLFETFIESMVATIDQRDPTTAGHSIRVAKYAAIFAKAVNQTTYGKYKNLYFSQKEIHQIYYAGLLHDIGKIGVKEAILLKRTKLSESELEILKYRFYYYKKELEYKKLSHIISEEEKQIFDEIDQYYIFICNLNTKGFITNDEIKILEKISSITFKDIDGKIKNLLNQSEYNQLTVKRGNLTKEQRVMMEYHPSYTYEILKSISWGKDLEKVPLIAAAHHEKLDGSGYPKGLKEDEILIPSKILAIVDIFEALTAKDRPYKKALPLDKTLKILQKEAKQHHLDKDLLEIFIHKKIYEEDIH